MRNFYFKLTLSKLLKNTLKKRNVFPPIKKQAK
ncbi:hypothetical protein SAMN05443549_101816 [Flavobacterium fluvii]|uniref:Uncharacterized protein n=1 Tax=Flavobacterium fluvii TaxID=468056 RepID=A0A1M5FKK0_9FLAO|nr:hypothetical protein SAMN05443549_101816 [Flavobacterium fluvii]